MAMQTEVRYQSEAMMIFPEFKKRSLVMMLQFLYTGEVGKHFYSQKGYFVMIILLELLNVQKLTMGEYH